MPDALPAMIAPSGLSPMDLVALNEVAKCVAVDTDPFPGLLAGVETALGYVINCRTAAAHGDLSGVDIIHAAAKLVSLVKHLDTDPPPAGLALLAAHRQVHQRAVEHVSAAGAWASRLTRTAACDEARAEICRTKAFLVIQDPGRQIATDGLIRAAGLCTALAASLGRPADARG